MALTLTITKFVSVLLGIILAIFFFLLTTFFAMEPGREVIGLITLMFGLTLAGMAIATMHLKSIRILILNVLLVTCTTGGVWWAILEVLKAWR